MLWPPGLVMVIAMFVTFASPALANPSEDAFATFLHRKYSKTGGLFGAVDKILPPSSDTSSPVPVEGLKGDGSYWWSAYYGPGNIGVFGWAKRAIGERCIKDGGTLELVAPYLLQVPAQSQVITLKDPGGGGDFSVTPKMIFNWSGEFIGDGFEATDRYLQLAPARNAALVDARAVLGIFSCRRGEGLPLWHLSILPTPVGAWTNFADNNSKGTHWVILRIQAITRTLVERDNLAYAKVIEENKQRVSAGQKADAQRREQWLARERILRPRIARFQQELKVGEDTNCGLILELKGPLVEVQVPTDIKLQSGASRVFVKRVVLAPQNSEFECYSFNIMTDRAIDTSPVK